MERELLHQEMDRLTITDIDSVENLRKKINNTIRVPPEGYLKWFIESNTAFPNSFEAAKLITALETSDKLSGLLKYQFWDIFSLQLNLTFLYTITYDDKSTDMLQTARQTLEEFRNIGPIDEEHLFGADFILESLNILKSIQFQNNSQQEVDIAMQNFQDLPKKSRAFILAMKARFYGEFIHSWVEEKDMINQAIQLDPSHWEWAFIKCKQLRWERRKGNYRSKPNLQEKEAVEKSLALNPNHPLCRFRMMECLAEFLKRENPRDLPVFPMTFAGKYFSTERETVAYLTEQAKAFRDEYPFSGWMNQLAKMFSSDFPSEFRNATLARSFLKQALSTSPNCSKINHRMGIFICQQAVVSGNEADFDEAELYLSKAVSIDPRNKPALLDQIKVWMRNDKNLQKLQQFFNHEFVPPTSYLEQEYLLHELLFLQGYFQFYFTREEKKAVETFLLWAYLIGDNQIWNDPKKNMFNRLGKMSYPWGWGRLAVRPTAEKISLAVDKYCQLHGRNYPNVAEGERPQGFYTLKRLLHEAAGNVLHYQGYR